MTEADLSAINILIGLPSNKRPKISINHNQEAPLPFYSSKVSSKQVRTADQRQIKIKDKLFNM